MDISNIKLDDNTSKVEFDELFENFLESKEVFKTGELNYRLVIEIFQCDDKHFVSLGAILDKSCFTESQLQSIAISACIELEEVNSYDISNEFGSASFGHIETDEEGIDLAIETISKKATVVPTLFGYFMDRVVNQVGNTNWDFILGNVGLSHCEECGTSHIKNHRFWGNTCPMCSIAKQIKE